MKYLEDDNRTHEEIHEDLMRRLSEPIKPIIVGHRELTEEEKEEARKFLEEIETSRASKNKKN